MSYEAALALLDRAFSQEGAWPLPSEKPILERLNTWAALYEGDAATMARVAGWTDARRRYRVDSLPERIADAWAAYLYGEDPRITPPAEADADLMRDLIRVPGCELPGELERGAALCVAQGEIWPRIYTDELAAPRPLLDWVSRRNVLPLWVGPRLAAAAVVTELPSGQKDVIHRHFETHSAGVVVNTLYAGSADNLGERIALTANEATAELVERWDTGLPGMLVGRIPNKLREDRRIGVSDYQGILDYLLDLNEAAIIGAHNARLTARKRAIVSASVLRPALAGGDGELTPEERPFGGPGGNPPAARFDPSEEVFVEDQLDKELGRDASSPVRILEYSFDAEALIHWKRSLVDDAISRVGLVAQYVGAAGLDAERAGYAISGTALRLRLIPTDKTGRAKARYQDGALPAILRTMAALDAMPRGSNGRPGGFARPWQNVTDLPVVERRPGLPEDEVEEAQRHATLVGGGLESVETAVRKLNPGQPDDWVAAEVARIREDKQAAPGFTLPMGA